jgi:hypothetical protein
MLEVAGSGLGALIESFGYVPGVLVLEETGRLLFDSKRRIFETANFTVAIIEHGLDPDSAVLEKAVEISSSLTATGS